VKERRGESGACKGGLPFFSFALGKKMQVPLTVSGGT